MFKFNELHTVQVEITSNCQASCPMCARNYKGHQANPKLIVKDWNINDFKRIFNHEVLNQIHTITFCGSLGDPLMNNDLLQMIEHAHEKEILIHTNGSLRSTKYWKTLAQTLPKTHKVLFGIDGLDDTHSLYRIGTNFHKIIDNAKAFIENNGIAEWVFIEFKHNSHQVEIAKELAKQLGFVSFVRKNSVRFTDEDFYVLDKTGKETYKIEPPKETVLSYVNKDTVKNFKQWFENTVPSCQVEKTKEIYIDFNKIMYPCCYIASSFYIYTKPNDMLHPYLNRINIECNKLLEELGGTKFLSLDQNSIKNIIESDAWQNIWDKKWNNKDLLICSKNCGISTNYQISTRPDQVLNTMKL